MNIEERASVYLGRVRIYSVCLSIWAIEASGRERKQEAADCISTDQNGTGLGRDSDITGEYLLWVMVVRKGWQKVERSLGK